MRNLLFLFFFVGISLEAQELKKIALVIGNSEYTSNESNWLKNPVNDAKLISSTLKDIGFDVYEYYNVKNRTDLYKYFKDYKKKIGNYDLSFIYYAGHGIQLDGENYIIPTDQFENLEIEDDIEEFCFPIKSLINNLSDTDRKQTNILVLDACRDNPFEKSHSRSIKGNGLSKIETIPDGHLIAYSTEFGKTASDGDSNNSLYTKTLSKYLNEPGLKIEDIFKKVRTEVKSISEYNQNPIEESQLQGDDVYLLLEDYTIQINQIKQLINSLELDKALELISFLLSENENRAYFLYLKSKIYFLKGNNETALNEITKAIGNDLNNHKYYIERAIYYEEDENYIDALHDYNYAIKIDSLNPDNYYYRSTSHVAKEKYEEALDDYNTCIRINPDESKYYYYRSSLYSIMGNQLNALNDVNQAIKIDSSDPDFFELRGEIHVDLGDNESALIDFNHVLKLVPEYVDIYNDIGNSYENLGEFKSALNAFNKVIEVYPENEYALSNIASLLNEPFESLSYITSCLAFNPENLFCLSKRAFLYKDIGEFNSAIMDYNTIIELDSVNSNAYFNKAIIYETQFQDFNTAIANYIQIIKFDSLDIDAYNNMAIIYHNEFQDFDKAINLYHKIIEIDPEDPITYFNLASLYDELREFNHALEYYSIAIKIEPVDYVYGARSQNYIKLDMYEMAVEDLDLAITINPEKPEWYYSKAILYYEHLKDSKNAIKSLNKGLKKVESKYDLYYFKALIFIHEKKLVEAQKNIDKCIELNSLDPASYYLQYLLNSNYSLRRLSSLEKSIVKLTDQEDYYIPLLDGSYIELEDLYILKAELYKSGADHEMMCRLLAKACELADCDSEKYKYIEERIVKECK